MNTPTPKKRERFRENHDLLRSARYNIILTTPLTRAAIQVLSQLESLPVLAVSQTMHPGGVEEETEIGTFSRDAGVVNGRDCVEINKFSNDLSRTAICCGNFAIIPTGDVSHDLFWDLQKPKKRITTPRGGKRSRRNRRRRRFYSRRR